MVLFNIKEEKEKRKKAAYKETYLWRDGILQYQIDEDNKRVTCVFMPIDEVDIYTTSKLVRSLPFGSVCFDAIEGIKSRKIFGVTKCAPEDKFNANTGKHVAFLKMRREYHSRIMQAYHDLLNDLRMKERSLQEIMEKEKNEYKKLKEKVMQEAS